MQSRKFPILQPIRGASPASPRVWPKTESNHDCDISSTLPSKFKPQWNSSSFSQSFPGRLRSMDEEHSLTALKGKLTKPCPRHSQDSRPRNLIDTENKSTLVNERRRTKRDSPTSDPPQLESHSFKPPAETQCRDVPCPDLPGGPLPARQTSRAITPIQAGAKLIRPSLLRRRRYDEPRWVARMVDFENRSSRLGDDRAVIFIRSESAISCCGGWHFSTSICPLSTFLAA
jgi:hypothetical protein